MEENGEPSFRVSVSLSRFFDDERALCYMWVAGGRRVRWLQRRLRRLFALPRRLALRSRGHLLPPEEPLALLRPDDPVEVIPLSADWSLKKLSTKLICTLEAEEQDLKDSPLDKKNSKGKEENNIDVDMPEIETDKSVDTHIGFESEITADNHMNSDKDKQHSDTENQNQKQLEQVKEQALSLLEIYEGTKLNSLKCPDVPSAQDRPRRARRRVRRRRPRAADDTTAFIDHNQSTPPVQSDLLNSSPDTLPSLELTCNITRCIPPYSNASTTEASSPLQAISPDNLRSSLAGAAILQNNEAAPRAPRLVRPLEENCYS